jgi:flap endonuclease 1 (EC 3.1.-.-)
LGVDLGPLIKSRRQIRVEELHGKSVAIDAYNALYQFLAVIRGEAGEPLTDSKGRVTSHLSGLYYRTLNLLEKGVKPVYVFDGKPPELKAQEIENRIRQRESARAKYEEALKRGDLESARTYAALSARLRDYMVEDAKRLLEALGVPWVQAPSEGEAEAAYMAAKGYVWASVSQDYDSLLFGSPVLVRNLTISGRRKLPRKDVYVEVVPELIRLDEVLGELGLTREQLVDLGILIGTDFNPDGIRGGGPRQGVQLHKEVREAREHSGAGERAELDRLQRDKDDIPQPERRRARAARVEAARRGGRGGVPVPRARLLGGEGAERAQEAQGQRPRAHGYPRQMVRVRGHVGWRPRARRSSSR